MSNLANEPLVECLKCGWIHFAVSREYVEDWMDGWIKFWPTLDAQGKENYGLLKGPPTTSQYLHCNFCGGSHKNFGPATKSLMGSTIGPILAADQDLA